MMTKKPPSDKYHSIIALLLITAVSFAAYGGTVANSFVYDDYKVVVENLMIKSWRNVSHLFNSSYFRKAGELSYRPVVTLSYFLDYTFWKLKPAGYHLTNVLWHTLNAILLYFCLRYILKRTGAALACSLFFAVHPVTAEAVNCVGFREDILAAGFSLFAFLLYLKTPARSSRRRRWFAGCWAAFICAIFSKENALVLPVICLLYEFCFSGRFLKRVKDRLALYAGFLFILAVYIPVRFVILIHSEKLKFYPPVFYHRMLTMSRIFFFYLRLLIFPARLSAEYKYPVSGSILDPPVFLSLAGILAILVIVGIIARRRTAYLFAAGWFFLALLPVANVIPLYNPVAERYLYFPVMGFCLFLSLAGESLITGKKRAPRYAAAVLFILIFCLYGARTVIRNRDWRDHFTFLKKTIETCPVSAKFHSNLGYIYEQKDMLEEAEKELLTALELDPDYDSAHHNLGSVYKKKGMLEEAVREYKTALRISPGMAGAHHNLGLVYGMQGRIEEAMKEFHAALKIDPDFAKSHFNIAFCYQNRGLLDEAVEEYQTALRLDPDDVKNHFYLGTLYEDRNEIEKAVEKYKAAIRADPGYVKSYLKLGDIFASKGARAEAEQYREKALNLDPSLDGLKVRQDALKRDK